MLFDENSFSVFLWKIIGWAVLALTIFGFIVARLIYVNKTNGKFFPRISFLIIVMLVVGFLPATIIFYGSMASIPLAIAIFAVYYGSKSPTHRIAAHFIFALLGLGLISYFYMTVILILPFLVFMVLFSILLYIWPSVINLLVSYWLAGFTRTAGLAKYGIILFISFVLGLNVRLPELAHVLMKSDTTQSIKQVLEISPDEPLVLETNAENVSYRLSRFEPIGIGGNEGCMCMYWTPPHQVIENVEDTLQRLGIRYRKRGGGNLRLVINSTENGGVTQLSATIWKNGMQTSSLTKYLRNSYPLVDKTDPKQTKSINDPILRAGYLLEHNFWNLILTPYFRGYASSDYPIRQFLFQSIRITSSPVDVKLNEPQLLHAVLVNEDHTKRRVNKDNFRRDNIFGCDEKVTVGSRYENYQTKTGYGISLVGSTLTFMDNDEKFTVVARNSIESVLCLDAGDLVIATPSSGLAHLGEIYVQQFSKKGKLESYYKIALPRLAYKGVPRKLIADFKQDDKAFTFTIIDADYDSGTTFSTYDLVANK